MARDERFQTNYELAAGLESIGRDIFVEAWKRDISEAKATDPLLSDKPLGNIALKLTAPICLQTSDILVRQQLLLHPTEILPKSHPRWTDNPESLAIRNAYAEPFRQTRSNDLDPSTIHVGMIAATYTTFSTNHNSSETSTTQEDPSGVHLLLAHRLGRSALSYVHSPHFDIHSNRFTFSIPGLYESFATSRGLSHQWVLSADAATPINGHESKTFLDAHYHYLSDQILIFRKQLEAHSISDPDSRQAQDIRMSLHVAEQHMATVEQHLFGA